MSAAGLAILASVPVVVLAAILWRRGLVATLPYLVAVNGFLVTIGGANLRLDQLVAVTGVAALITAALIGQGRLFLDRPAKWLLVVAAIHVLSSAVYSPDPAYSLRQTASLIGVWSVYLVVINAMEDMRDARVLHRHVRRAGFLAAAVGVVAFALNRAGFPVGGANVDTTVNAPFGAFGTMFEPNIYGSYCEAYFILAVATILFQPRSVALRWAWPLALIAGLGLLLSFTRGAWLGALVGIPMVVLLARHYAGLRVSLFRLLVPVAVVSVIAAVLWFLPTDAGEFFRFKVRNLVNAQSENAVVRLLLYGLALEQWTAHPLLGWGTFSFAPLTSEGINFREFEGWQALWIGNFLLQHLHDTGIVGLAAFLAFLWALIRDALASVRSTISQDRPLALEHLALVAAFTSLLVPFFFTTGFTLGYSWMFAGLVSGYVRVSARLYGRHPVTSASVEPTMGLTGPASSPAGV